ncbi:hypothetical protein [Nannocystis radixulma]|uniref:Uncharacterized protein n=1 Tax=Nannocystis radixulma TaxID=2995305 RepID=A0ABT5B4T8_9BACT|nr:hypothetical protein [Nannocystis radixulma]MDC0668534.1 hypothetical protein [Nannocystis radixulma]
MTPRRRIILLAAAAAHLALVVVGAFGICLWAAGPPGKLLTYYSTLSGADSSYGYFAPGVGSPPTATFTVVDAEGRAFVDTLAPRFTREGDIRVEDLLEVFEKGGPGDEALRAELAASWAANLFERHPRAASVTIDMGKWRVPTMAGLRNGKPTRWRSFYRARVVRPPHSAGGSP